jgi:hypothetical protein
MAHNRETESPDGTEEWEKPQNPCRLAVLLPVFQRAAQKYECLNSVFGTEFSPRSGPASPLQMLLSSPKRLDWLWTHSVSNSVKNGSSFPRSESVKCKKMTTDIKLMPSLGICWNILPTSTRFHCAQKENFICMSQIQFIPEWSMAS